MYTYRVSSKYGYELMEAPSLTDLQRLLCTSNGRLKNQGDSVDIVTPTQRMITITKQVGAKHHTHNGFNFQF